MARSPELPNLKPSKHIKHTVESEDPSHTLPLRNINSNSRPFNGATLSRASEPIQSLPPILRLANEVLDLILDRIEADPSKGVNVDRRAYLSQESFRPAPEPLPTASSSRVQDLSSWRQTCKRFSELGAPHQFSRVTTRFSREEFGRLEWLAGQKHLVQHVKKFSYMVPWFYIQGQERIEDALTDVHEDFGVLDVQVFSGKIEEQKSIVESKVDFQALKRALSAFTKLQHIQILPFTDAQDRRLLAAMRHHTQITQYVELKWAPAYSHSTRTIGEALLETQSPFKRFSSPWVSPASAVVLAQHHPGNDLVPGISDSLGRLASSLTCLELHFEDGGVEMDSKMRDLSPLFKIVFTAARNLEAVHVGFPSNRPLSLRLEDLFHNVKWDSLLAFGIQGWKLDGDEIMAVAGRHREKLRGLRLRDVQLNEGSLWKDVLVFLRNEMRSLDWVSLRRIGYASHFESQVATAGVEVPDDPPGGYSSDSDNDFDNNDEDSHGDGDSDSDQESVASASTDPDFSDDEHGMAANEVDFPSCLASTPTSSTWCNCGENSMNRETAEELGDNGEIVENSTRRIWEQWVVRRCPEHSVR